MELSGSARTVSDRERRVDAAKRFFRLQGITTFEQFQARQGEFRADMIATMRDILGEVFPAPAKVLRFQ